MSRLSASPCVALALALALAPTSARAAAPYRPSGGPRIGGMHPLTDMPGDSPFEKARAFFEAGEAAELAILPGWHSGVLHGPEGPAAPLLMAIQPATAAHPGDDPRALVGVALTMADERLGYFDQMSVHQAYLTKESLWKIQMLPRLEVGGETVFVAGTRRSLAAATVRRSGRHLAVRQVGSGGERYGYTYRDVAPEEVAAEIARWRSLVDLAP